MQTDDDNYWVFSLKNIKNIAKLLDEVLNKATEQANADHGNTNMARIVEG